MFKYQIHALAMRKLGLARPLGYLALVVLLGCVIAGAIYFAVIFHAVEQRSHPPHVHAHSNQ
jgi:hypothetical protein